MDESDSLCFEYDGRLNPIPRRIDRYVAPDDIGKDFVWSKVKVYKVAKFDLNVVEDVSKYCEIMSNAINGRFKVVNLNRTFLQTSEGTRVIIDLEYYEQEFKKKH